MTREPVGANLCDEAGHEWPPPELECDRCGKPRRCDAPWCHESATTYDKDAEEFRCATHAPGDES